MSHFEVQWQVIPLKLREAFTISRGTKTEVRNVFLSITKNGVTGYGEAGPNTRYNETAEKVSRYFQQLPQGFFDKINAVNEIEPALKSLSAPSIYSAQAAIEMAWLDWHAKSFQKPLWRLWDEGSPAGPLTSYTIGLDSPQKMQQKIRQAAQYPIYKIKLGTGRDREVIQAIREVTDKPLRVDANEGWTTTEQARREIDFLATQNVELVEQPMPASALEEMKTLKEWSPLPLAADESFTGNENLQEIGQAFHIINIKLMKIGSLVKARMVMQQARKMGLKVMIGCMIESSLANAAGTLLALNAQYADLDGHLLISNDPFRGLEVEESGCLKLSEAAGFGVEKVDTVRT